MAFIILSAMRGEKIIRDPVHDVIAFRLDRPGDRLLFRLLNAAEFQRLRRIKQLGMASLAYPGAEHSRYSHSLGVMETARRMLEHLGRSVPLDEGLCTATLAAALLHDLGHGPFSHVFERVSGIEHEKTTYRLIEDPASDIHRILVAHDRQLPELIVKLLRHEIQPPVLPVYADVLSGQLDADRFDYLLRDNLMTGSQYGDYDLRWLLHALTVEPANGRLAVSWKGVSAIEAYLQSRYHMYRNVYFHKTVRSAEGMMRLALHRARRLAVQDRLGYPPRENLVYKALLGQKLDTHEFLELDDVSVQHCLKHWMHAEDTVLALLCRGLLFRRLFKTFDLTRVAPAQATAAVAAAGDAITAAGGESAYEMFLDEPADTPYETYHADDSATGGIWVQDPAGKLTPFQDVSPISQALNKQLMFRRLHVSPGYKDAVGYVLQGMRIGRE